jgi:ankyrin repeat protein
MCVRDACVRRRWRIGAKAQNGKTALISASENGHVECARLLLDAGADKDAKTEVRGVFVCLIEFVMVAAMLAHLSHCLYVQSISSPFQFS